MYLCHKCGNFVNEIAIDYKTYEYDQKVPQSHIIKPTSGTQGKRKHNRD